MPPRPAGEQSRRSRACWARPIAPHSRLACRIGRPLGNVPPARSGPQRGRWAPSMRGAMVASGDRPSPTEAAAETRPFVSPTGEIVEKVWGRGKNRKKWGERRGRDNQERREWGRGIIAKRIGERVEGESKKEGEGRRENRGKGGENLGGGLLFWAGSDRLGGETYLGKGAWQYGGFCGALGRL